MLCKSQVAMLQLNYVILPPVILYCWSQFFVACDPSAPREQLWQEEYSLHCEMVPSFIPQSLAQKVYSSIYSCILLLCVLLINWKINQFSVAKMSWLQSAWWPVFEELVSQWKWYNIPEQCDVALCCVILYRGIVFIWWNDWACIAPDCWHSVPWD